MSFGLLGKLRRAIAWVVAELEWKLVSRLKQPRAMRYHSCSSTVKSVSVLTSGDYALLLRCATLASSLSFGFSLFLYATVT